MSWGKIKRVFADSWRNRDALTNAKEKANDDVIEFLPAALEVMEKPPSPLGRMLGYSVMALFTITILWGIFGHVDIVSTAEGKIIPGGRVKEIQPLQIGVIKNIFVEEGQLVEKGQALIELDQTLTGADRNRLQNEMRFLANNLIRERILSKFFWIEEQLGVADFSLKEKFEQYVAQVENDEQVILTDKEKSLQWMMIKQRWQEYYSEQAIVKNQLQNRQLELESVRANVKKYQATIPLINKRVKALDTLNQDGLIAEAQLLELQEQQVTQKQNLVAETAKVEQIKAAIEEVKHNQIAQRNNARKLNLEQIENFNQQLQSKREEYNKALELYSKQVLYAPVKGRIKQLNIHTIGGVVEPAKTLMQIVPEEDYLEVEAILENKDIGFVNKGMAAEIKVHTFPFTKYGLVNAEVVDITADAIESEQQGLVYKVRLKMEQNQLYVNQKWVDLLPGMAVSAEMKTGKRRLIEFFLAPLLRYKEESVRER